MVETVLKSSDNDIELLPEYCKLMSYEETPRHRGRDLDTDLLGKLH